MITSRDRVARYGEVFTGEREVNAMLDLVKDETERIDSRFLEPACGTGNFLIEILRRKLVFAHSDCDIVQAVSSIYGIDILEDNVAECRERLLAPIQPRLHQIAAFILEKNIICGDTLAMQTNNGPIVFSEWTFDGEMVQRRDFLFSELVSGQLALPKIFPFVHFTEISN